MNKAGLAKLWSDTVRMPGVGTAEFERIAAEVRNLCASDEIFRRYIGERADRVTARTGQVVDPDNFDTAAARAYVADELGFTNWQELVDGVGKGAPARPLLFEYAVAAMERGDFSALESTIGGPARFHDQILEWFEGELFEDEPETLNEVLSAACMLGHTQTVEYLLDRGVDPYEGMRSWLAGPHYAVSGGWIDTVKLFLRRGIRLEVENRYGGTLLGQALWSAVHEPKETHPAIIEMLIAAGARVEPGTKEWWDQQNVPPETKALVAKALEHDE